MAAVIFPVVFEQTSISFFASLILGGYFNRNRRRMVLDLYFKYAPRPINFHEHKYATLNAFRK
jgi:hypothetical protein